MARKKTDFPVNFFPISIRYGIITALLMMFFTFITFLIFGSANRPVLIWMHLILLILMYFAVKAYRWKLKGYISFKQCYISGLFTGIFASLFFAIFVYINTQYIDKELINNFVSISEVAMNNYISGEELQRQKDILNQYSTPVFMGIRAAGELILISLFLPLLMSIFLKKERKAEELVNNND